MRFGISSGSSIFEKLILVLLPSLWGLSIKNITPFRYNRVYAHTDGVTLPLGCRRPVGHWSPLKENRYGGFSMIAIWRLPYRSPLGKATLSFLFYYTVDRIAQEHRKKKIRPTIKWNVIFIYVIIDHSPLEPCQDVFSTNYKKNTVQIDGFLLRGHSMGL